MKITLSRRLFLAVLCTTLFVALAMAMAGSWSFTRGFIGHINELGVARLESIHPRFAPAYREHGSWDFVRDNPDAWFNLTRPNDWDPESSTVRQAPLSDLTGAVFRIALLDAEQQRVRGLPVVGRDAVRLPIVVDGATVGWLTMTPFQSVTEALGERLFQRQLQASLAIAVLVLLLATLTAGWATRRLLAPMLQVAAATHRLAAGDYAGRVLVQSDDEVGQLARDFNQLAYTLERNEQMRREFMADISHELRTPLAVLRGELEALEDGVRKLDGDSLRSLQQEVGQLNQLVDDLHELSLADVGALTYRKQPQDLVEVLQQALSGASARCQEQGLTLALQLPLAAMPVMADAARLRQLLGNLLENSLRYTSAGGQLRIRLQEQDDRIVLDWLDSAPGVAETDLPRLFERFFRGEASRGRASGGSGLGLAICRSIAEAHGGSLQARPSPLGGLWLQLSLPKEIR
ncbi:ATP-binding protein [Pseudomonas lopnurensis]|uniref:ATP-binding protein n=1 Tax=Pseudomonas lopnurensis TaxID=1477517 RepID=UPI0018796581|nr:ATP-binding protein [Pseudomonas lopnurensis]MBE7374160.1 HAMP domain-containing protein [Pseudomonas lopnurensis]